MDTSDTAIKFSVTIMAALLFYLLNHDPIVISFSSHRGVCYAYAAAISQRDYSENCIRSSWACSMNFMLLASKTC